MKVWAGALLLLTFGVIVLGAYTRLTDAGLGCPDWPGCYGQILVPQSEEDIQGGQNIYPPGEFDRQKALTEMAHRAVAAILGLLIFVIAIMDYLRARRQRQKMSRLLLFLCLVVVAQGAFGAWTVTLKLLPQVVLIHLLGGFLIFSMVYLYFLSLGNIIGRGPPQTKRFFSPWKIAIGFGGILLIEQIILGGWVSANYAARVCADFPLCNGEWIPSQADFIGGFNFWQPLGPNYEGGVLSTEAQLAIHFAHRLNAFVLLLYWLLLFYWGRRNHFLRASAPLFVGLLLFQMALGITNILADLPLMVAVAHNGLAAILLLNFLHMFTRYQDNFVEQPATQKEAEVPQ